MEIVIQWVRTSWTGRSRGGPAAAIRNAVPIGFALPVTGRSLLHEVTLTESGGFTPRATTRELPSLPPRTTVAGVVLTRSEGRLRVRPTIPALFGIPPRPRRPPAAGLEPGQWIRWRLNYRFSSLAGMNDWSYHLHTLNLAYGTIEPDAFLDSPTFLVDERGSLR